MTKHPFTWRPDETLFRQVEERAKEKGLSVNEWINRAVTAGLLRGGKTKTTVIEKEF